MTLPDPGLDRSGVEPGNIQDRIPPTERNQDPGRSAITHDLVSEGAHPLTRDERDAAERDSPVGERVYAPASERVPREPMPGHREFVEHTDPNTPERHAAQMTGSPGGAEPSFTRVARPSTIAPSAGFAPGAPYGVSSRRRRGTFLGLGLGWLALSGCAAAVWLYLRWQRERNKPINRLRRQARQAATEMRERVPGTEEVQPAMGLTAALLSTALVLWRQARAQRSRDVRQHAPGSLADADWQRRLGALKERWSPRRVELERVSISRH